jgi:hypothetical protein
MAAYLSPEPWDPEECEEPCEPEDEEEEPDPDEEGQRGGCEVATALGLLESQCRLQPLPFPFPFPFP